MIELEYINEKQFKEVINRESERVLKQGKRYIMSPNGFATHLIGTGQKAEKIAKLILKNHPSLRKLINPEIVKVAGFMHDFGRFNVGDPFHEIDGAYTILAHGEKLKLVKGGSNKERLNALKQMALCLPSDGLVFEQLGNPLEQIFYTQDIASKLSYLQKELFYGENSLSLEEITSPKTIEQRIVIYSDYKNLEGEDMSLGKRMREVCARYKETSRNVTQEDVENYDLIAPGVSLKDLQNHYKNVSLLVQQTMPHIITSVDSIDELLRQ